jgi:uncharacterized protein YecE (DUF72 family)
MAAPGPVKSPPAPGPGDLQLPVMAHIHLGTSGYVYRHWRGVLYPKGLPASRWLAQYAQVFSTVELNATFYRLPTSRAAAGWREGTPEGFVFAAKGSRYLTHLKRLTDVERGLTRFFDPLEALGNKLAVVLWQLPPQMNKADLPRLERFLAALPTRYRHAFEARAEGWYTEAVADLLDRHGVAFCEHDLVDRKIPRPTGGFRYLRFHGPLGYRGRYGKRRLEPVAQDLLGWRARGRDAFVFFNNDLEGHAIQDALALAHCLGAGLPRALEDAAPAIEAP